MNHQGPEKVRKILAPFPGRLRIGRHSPMPAAYPSFIPRIKRTRCLKLLNLFSISNVPTATKFGLTYGTKAEDPNAPCVLLPSLLEANHRPRSPPLPIPASAACLASWMQMRRMSVLLSHLRLTSVHRRFLLKPPLRTSTTTSTARVAPIQWNQISESAPTASYFWNPVAAPSSGSIERR